jgi:hypothetical protein
MRSAKVIFSLSEKLWTEKYPSRRFSHLSTESTSMSPSSNGISKFTCTLKGVAWSFDEDVSHVGSRQRIFTKMYIISFLRRTRASSRNSLKGSPTPSYLFSSPISFFGLGMADIEKARLVRVLNSCTQILSGTCTKKNKGRVDRSDTIDPDL